MEQTLAYFATQSRDEVLWHGHQVDQIHLFSDLLQGGLGAEGGQIGSDVTVSFGGDLDEKQNNVCFLCFLAFGDGLGGCKPTYLTSGNIHI